MLSYFGLLFILMSQKMLYSITKIRHWTSNKKKLPYFAFLFMYNNGFYSNGNEFLFLSQNQALSKRISKDDKNAFIYILVSHDI